MATLEKRRAAITKAAKMVRDAENGGCVWLRRARPATPKTHPAPEWRLGAGRSAVLDLDSARGILYPLDAQPAAMIGGEWC